jgi:hypothetical protein
MKMKKQILISLISIGSILTMNAQWNGTTNLDDNLWRNGNVGIGTVTPSRLLTIRKDVLNGVGAGIMLMNNQYSGNNGAETEIIFSNYTDTDNPFRYFKIHNVGAGINGLPDRLSFGSSDLVNSIYQDWLTIKSSGNIGIGTISPTSKLDINQSSNTDWAAQIFNTGGSGKGLRIKCASGDDNTPIAQMEDNIGNVRMIVQTKGNVGIGTTSPAYKLDVNGTIRANEVKVCLPGGCDFVFKSDYKLMDLKKLEEFVKINQHLPEIAPEKEMVENGVNMKELQMKLLQKIEELTLYTIEQNKELQLLKEKIARLEAALK